MKTTAFFTVAGIASGAFASPAPTFGGRAFEGGGVHLVDCRPRDTSEGSDKSWLSLVIFCEDDVECNNVDYVPQARDICVKKTSSQSLDYNKWETSDWQHCYFAERGVFSWVIGRFARLFPPATEVGLGEDVDKHDFSGYRDDELQGAGPVTHNCSKIYYFTGV